MTTVCPPICLECKFFRAEDDSKMSCEAFPSGIPAVILLSSVDHRKPYGDDHNIQFQPLYPDRVGDLTGNPLLTGEA